MIKVTVMWKDNHTSKETFSTPNQLAFFLLGLGMTDLDAILITYP